MHGLNIPLTSPYLDNNLHLIPTFWYALGLSMVHLR